MVVTPSASTAAIRTLAVPVTLEPNAPPRNIFAPVNFGALI
jgi:hypothetical protein